MRAILPLFILSVAALASAAIVTKHVTYTQGGVQLEGYLAYDNAKSNLRPGILVIHDWDGLTEYEERRTRQLAELGYVAFAADIYGKGVHPSNNQENAAQAGKYRGDIPLFRERLKAGLNALKAQNFVNKNKIAAIGYCFGGGGVLELARTGADIRGVVAFHGDVRSSTNDAGNIKCRVNIQHGALDPLVPVSAVDTFRKEMDAAKIDYSITLYANAVHAFTEPEAGQDPSHGVAHNELADKRSWKAMKDFFNEIFGS